MSNSRWFLDTEFPAFVGSLRSNICMDELTHQPKECLFVLLCCNVFETLLQFVRNVISIFFLCLAININACFLVLIKKTKDCIFETRGRQTWKVIKMLKRGSQKLLLYIEIFCLFFMVKIKCLLWVCLVCVTEIDSISELFKRAKAQTSIKIKSLYWLHAILVTI